MKVLTLYDNNGAIIYSSSLNDSTSQLSYTSKIFEIADNQRILSINIENESPVTKEIEVENYDERITALENQLNALLGETTE